LRNTSNADFRFRIADLLKGNNLILIFGLFD